MTDDWYTRTHKHRISVLDNAEAPDNMAARLALLKRVDAGEITLEEAQKQTRTLRLKREKMQREGKLPR
jgi:hypothetical protein